MDEVAATELTMAYIRRKRIEARLIAAEVGKLFGGGDGKRQQASVAQLAAWGIGVG